MLSKTELYWLCLCEWLKEQRLRRGLSQFAVSAAIGRVHRSHWSRVEGGERKLSLSDLLAVSVLFGYNTPVAMLIDFEWQNPLVRADFYPPSHQTRRGG